MKISLYVLSFNAPEQFVELIQSILAYDVNFLSKTEKILVNNSTDISLLEEYTKTCSEYNFTQINFENIGIMGARKFISNHFDESDSDYYFFFEDDMLLSITGHCKNGFRRYVPDLFNKSIEIIIKESFDFLKLSFSEVYLSNDINYPKTLKNGDLHRKKYIKTKFNNISFLKDLGYIDGEVYLCNWPILFSRSGNYKCYLDKKVTGNFESSISQNVMLLIEKGEIKSSVLLLSPVNHNRLVQYDNSLRKNT